jgi:methionyl-tRNA formyltransferase
LYHDLKGGKVKNLLRLNNIPVKSINNVNSESFRQYLTELKVDLIVSNNCPQLLKEKLLNIPKKGAINLHLGKLPYYRGVYPIFHAIVNNEPHFGVTVHYMNVKFDDGPIINQETIPIRKKDSLFDLYPKAFKLGSSLIILAIIQIKSGNITTVQNGENGKSYFSYPDFYDIIKYRLRYLSSLFSRYKEF